MEAGTGPASAPSLAYPADGLLQHILLPMDGSAIAEAALPYGKALAVAFGARITLQHVLEPPKVGIQVNALEWDVLRERAHDYLDGVVRRFDGESSTIMTAVGEGSPVEQIIQHAAKHHADVIVVCRRHERGPNPEALSQTAHMIVRAAPTSVLLVPAEAATPNVRFRRILLPLDCSVRSGIVLPLAAHLALAHDAELTLGHVVLEPEIPRRLPGSAQDRDLLQPVLQHIESVARAELAGIAARLSARGCSCRTALIHDHDAANGIASLADESRADLIMLAAHGATGRMDRLYGGVTEQVIQHGGRPLFIVRERLRPEDTPATGGGESAPAAGS